MTKAEVIAHYGGAREVAGVLGIAVSAVHQWKSVPMGRQYQLELLTKGRLKAEKAGKQK
jgi:hypothetical protein